MSDDPTYLAQLEPLLEGLRKAGVPNNDGARRLAAIPAVAFMGYSRLTGEDEARFANIARRKMFPTRSLCDASPKPTGDRGRPSWGARW